MSAAADPAAREFVRRYWPENDPRPKHERLRAAFTASIIDGYWLPGARLPTETELVAATPCSLGTIQRALRDLAGDGIIERRRGSGSIVADHDRSIDRPLHMRFRDPAKPEAGLLPVYTRAVKREILVAPGPWSTMLGGEDIEVLRIDRVFTIGEELRIYAIFRAAASRFPDLAEQPLAEMAGTNLKLLIGSRHRLAVHRVAQQLRMEMPPVRICRESDCRIGEPVSVLNAIALSLDGEAIYHQDFYIPRSRLVLELGTLAV